MGQQETTIPFRRKYAPGYCEYPTGYDEIRWDVSGCNLSCHFCWSPASRPRVSGDPIVRKTPHDILNDTMALVSNADRVFIRFTARGSKGLKNPCLNYTWESNDGTLEKY